MQFEKSDKIISGVEVKKIDKIVTYDKDKRENGWLIDVLRGTDRIKRDGNKFSQVYVTAAHPGMVKGFHWHKKKTDLFCVVGGKAKLVLVDDNEDSPTKGLVNEFIMGEDDNFILVRVPPLIKHAFKNIGGKTAYILNYMVPAYNKDDSDDYSWEGYDID